jgi:hypothetical protein
MLSLRLRPRHAAAICALALLGAAAPAGADTITDYSVDVQAHYYYEHHVAPPNARADIVANLDVAAKLPKVSFRDGVVVSAGGGGKTTISNVASRAHLENHTPTGTVTAECTGNDGTVDVPAIVQNGGRPWPGADATVIVRPFGVLGLKWTCTGPTPFQAGYPLLNIPDASGQGPLDIAFTLPEEATTMGKVIQVIDQDVPTEKCPLRSAETTSCTLQIKGQVTFTRTGQHTEQPPASGTTAPPAFGDTPEALEPLVRRVKLKRDGSTTTFTFTCGAGCTLIARVYTGGGGPRAASVAGALATKRVTLAHGGTRRVTIRFGKAARRAIRRAGGARLDISVKPLAGGKAVRRSVRLKL